MSRFTTKFAQEFRLAVENMSDEEIIAMWERICDDNNIDEIGFGKMTCEEDAKPIYFMHFLPPRYIFKFAAPKE